MRGGLEGGGCFPTGRHYPGIAHLLRIVAAGIAEEYDAAFGMEEMSFVSIDTETTGRDPAVDRIVEIACVVFRGGQIVSKRHWLVNPQRAIPKEAVDVHGISDDDVRDKPTFREVCSEILEALGGGLPVAYNAEFDRKFLVDELTRAGVTMNAAPPAARKGVEWVDPLVWARELQKEEKGKSLAEVASRIGINIERAHRATDDAEAAVRVLHSFFSDVRVPKTYGAFIHEQRRLARLHFEDRAIWQNRIA